MLVFRKLSYLNILLSENSLFWRDLFILYYYVLYPILPICFISYLCTMFLCFSLLKSPIPADLICFNYSPL
nr:MAG TPA: hypothetical protein [Caudoviricetes sp.]